MFYIHIGVILLIYLICELLIWLVFGKWKYEELYKLEQKDLKEITLAEFEQLIKEGKKYCLMDQYVIDVCWYRWEHPGSTYAIDNCIGKEIGKYIYGSYSQEDWVNPWKHSWVAGAIIRSLVVAKIKDKINDGLIQPTINADPVNSPGQMFDSGANVYTITKKSEIMKDIYRFQLSNGKTKFVSYYPNLNQSGRGYVVNSRQNNISRYYTICNCMNEKYYDYYMEAFNAILEGRQRKSNLILNKNVWQEKDNFVELVIKVYHQAKRGVATQICNATEGDQFIMDGPYGKALDFGFPNASGTYLLFVGGTGILPYMDIFAYMVRKVISEKSNIGEIFPGESFDGDLSNVNFIIHGFYPDAQRACGYEFTQKVAEVFEKLGCGNQFQFKCTFTRNGGKRLDKQQLDELMNDYAQKGGVRRLWVCGPPPMNNMFTKYQNKVTKTLGIEKEHLEIL